MWSTPADLSARVTRRFDVAPGSKPSTVHLEGDVTPVVSATSTQLAVALATDTTSSDPLSLLLPVPGTITYRARVVAPPAAPINGIHAELSINSRIHQFEAAQMYGSFTGGEVLLTGNPMAAAYDACHVGEACPELTITVIPGSSGQGAPPTSARFHWSLDVAVYSFTDVPVSVSAEQLTP